MPLIRSLQRIAGPAATRRDLLDQERLRLLLAFSLSPDSNCVDVGANVGDVLAEIVRLAPTGRHIAYEPIPELAAELRRRFPAVDVREAAASDRQATAEFFRSLDRPGLSGMRRRRELDAGRVEKLSVPIEDLDSALPAGYVPTLLKIDVEGAERDVLVGARRTIVEHRPIVVFEHGAGAAPLYGTGPDEVFELLSSEAGLRIFDLDGNGPYDAAGFHRVFADGSYWNFVAHP